MKRTIKQWCVEHDVGWLGQGTSGGIKYDWKLVLGKDRTAIFSTMVEGKLPEPRRIGKRYVLIFPNVNRSRGNGKISKTAFLGIIKWVEDCLSGNMLKPEVSNQTKSATRRKYLNDKFT